MIELNTSLAGGITEGAIAQALRTEAFYAYSLQKTR
jgi:hypothetical protein